MTGKSRLLHSLRYRPLGSSAALALGLFFGTSTTAHAQMAFQGVPTVQSGGATIESNAFVDTITVFTDQVVIDWLPDDMAINGADIDFLPAANTAIYQSDMGGPMDYTVLNRIIPVDNTRPIILNGNITSQVTDGFSGFLPGGNVWFYAPGGIVIGGTAVIDVGGLFLTTADPLTDPDGDFIDLAGTTNFAQAVSGTFAAIDAGASITLTPENSYVGLLAPIVTQSGDVDVNGSAAYIAAEQASITFNQGLFDINVTIGTDGDVGGVAILHDGITAGPASSGVGDNHRVYAVAVPKNNAISIAIQNGGDIGFDIAGAADVVGNAVILSAGHNVAGDVIANTPVNAIDASIEIENNSFTSAVTARASHNITATANAGAMAFASNLTLRADDLVDVMANGPGSAITVDGITNLSADVQGVLDGEDATGGVIGILGSGGTITLNGDVMLSANGTGADNFGVGKLGDGFGGIVEIGAEGGGTVNITGAVTMNADGIGGFSGSGVDGGNGTGGTGRLLANDGNSTVSITGNLSISAASNGSPGNGGLNDTNGNAVGGTITISGIGGANNLIDIGGFTTLGVGALGADAFSGNAGSAIGGDITVDAGSGTTLNFGGSLVAGATVMGGNNDAIGSGGDATGGSMLITTSDATGIITTGANVQLGSPAIGGFSSMGISGNAQGGSTTIRSGPGSITTTGPVELNAEAFGENSTFGGSVSLETTGGNLTINDNANLSANGITGSGSNDGTGGNATISANGGMLTIGGTSFASADGLGGFDGGAGAGDGFGGTVNLLADGGGIVNLVGDATFISSGTGGDSISAGGGSGNGTAGSIVARAGANSTVSATAQLTLQANGFGGANDGGSDGGDGTAGTISVEANGGNASFLVGTDTFIFAEALDASDGGANINGGNTLGGSVTISGSGGTNNLIDLGATTINAFAQNINISSGNGGTATGGNITITADTGTSMNFNGLIGTAFGTGGMAMGAGGDGAGGAIQLSTNGSLANIFVAGALDLSVDGNGSAGDSGGDGVGGFVGISVGPASTIDIVGNTMLSGIAVGGTSIGNGGNGGNATGGSADITALGGGDGALSGNGLNIAVNATGGIGGAGFDGGTATSGAVTMQARNSAAGGLSSISFGDTVINSTTSAGNGGNAIGGAPGGNGGDAVASGAIALLGSSGSGVLTLGNVNINSSATGGLGGTGGDGGVGTGGNGGSGGSATATFVQVGTTSGIDTPANLGAATFGNMIITADAVAGNGGDGGTGAIVGDGGNGGEAFASELTLLSRGSPVIIGDVNYTAQSAGGDGGAGTAQGNGGNATGSNSTILVTNRFNRIEQGSLNAGNVSIFSTANAGAGAVAGTSTVGIGVIDVVQGTATIASYDAFISGDTAGAGDPPSFFSAVDGTLNVTNDLTLVTDSNIAVVTDTGNITIGGNLDLNTNGTFVVSSDGMPPVNPGLLSVGGTTLLTSATDVILSTNIDAVAGLITAVTGDVNFGDIVSGGVIDIAVTGNLQTGSLSSVGDLMLDATGTLATGDLDSSGALIVSADSDLMLGNLTAVGPVQATSVTGNVTALAVDTDGDAILTANAGAVTAGVIDAGANVQVDALNAITLTDVTALMSAQITSQTGTISGGTVDTGDDFIVAGLGMADIDFTAVTAGGLIDIASNGALTLGAVDGGVDVALASATGLDTGLVQAVGAVAIASDGPVDVLGISAGSNVDIMATGSSASFGNIDSGMDIVIDAADALILIDANAGGLIDIVSGGNAQTGSLTSVGDLMLDAAGILTTGDLDSAAALTVSTDSDVMLGNLSAMGAVQATSLNGNLSALAVNTDGDAVLTANAGAVTAGIIDAGANVNINALNAISLSAVTAALSAQVNSQTGTISGGTIDTGDDFIVAPVGTADIDFNDVTAGGMIDIASNGALTIGAVDGGMDVVLTGTTGLDTGVVQAVGAVAIASGGLVAVQDITAGANVDIAVTGGSASFGNIDAATDIVVDAVGALTLANANAGGLIDIVAGGNVQTGSLTSPDDIRLDSDQSILGTGAIMTDGAFVSQALGSGSYGNITAQGVGNGGILGIAIDTVGGIVTGDLTTGSATIGLLTPAAITTGTVTSATDAILLAGTTITTNAISTANGPDNFIYLANESMQASFGPGGDPTPLFALDPVATSGSITINNAVSGNLVAATAGDFVSQGNITLSTLFRVDAAGLAGFGGVLTASTISLISSDIDIGAGGGLGDENTTELTLTNIGADGASIGDVAGGPLGYDLSNAEAGRLRANMISIESDGSGGVVIGDLDLTGSNAIGSNLVGPDGALQISSTDDIRVSGTLNLTDMATDNLLSLTGDTIGVASDTGGIVLEGNSPGGTLNLSARHIHVGSAALLDQLAVDPFFTGRDTVLARATPTGNPDGSIQAARITFAAEDTLLIQNVGEGGIAYGFYAETGEVEIIPTGADDLDVFVFGATLNVDDTQVLNDDVLATVFPVAPADGFTAGSSINGCLLATAVCVNLVSEDTPIAVSVRDTVQEQQQQQAAEEGAEEELTEEEKEEAEEKATSKSPISRTVSIINTSPMNSTGSISEPVTSGGNPNLMGVPSSVPSDDISKVDGL